MNKWEMVKLGSINNYQSKSVNPMKEPDRKFELYSVPSYEKDYPEIVTGAEVGSTKQTVQEGDVLLCKINPRINRVWSVTKYTEYPLIASSEWIIIRNNDISSNYLVWCLKSRSIRNLMTTNVTGIGGSLIRVQPKQVKEYLIPLPPLKTQKRIAEILDNAAELLAMSKQQLAELDNLIKSTFFDMFGDPVTNEKGWDIVSIVDVCTEIVDCVNKTAPIIDGFSPYKMLRTTNIKNGHIDTQNVNFVDEHTFKKWTRRSVPRRGDVLLTREAPIGETGIIESDESLFLGQRIVSYRVNGSMMHPLYIMYLMQSEYFQYQIRKLARGSTVKHLSVPECNLFEVYAPPLSLQTQFAEIVTKIEEQKALVQKAIDETQYLFDSLMSQYFD